MRKLNAAIAFGVIVAVLGAALVLVYGRHVDQRIAAGQHRVSVLVADTALAQGTPVAALRGKVHVAQVPQAYLVAHPLAKLSDLSSVAPQGEAVGDLGSLVLVGPIAQGAQLSRDMFGAESSAATLAPSPGHVAVAVDADLTPGVARYVTAGSHIDLFVTYNNVSGATGGSAAQTAANAALAGLVSNRTKLFMSSVRVLSVSEAQVNSTQKNSDGSTSNQLANKVLAVLDLSPTAAEKVINAVQLGSLYFALDTSGAHTTPSGATPGDVIGSNR